MSAEETSMLATKGWACALLWAVSLSARAELLTVYTGRNGSWVAVETSSLEKWGKRLRYRLTFSDYRGQLQERRVFADCVDRTRSEFDDGSMYSVYPETNQAKEVDFACSLAVKNGILTAAEADPKTALRGAAGAAGTANSQSPHTPQAASPADPAESKSAPAVKTERRAKSTGSGFFVSSNLVVTNYHVVEGCLKYSVRKDMTVYDAALQASTERNDLALLKVDAVGAVVPSVRAGAALGEDIMVAGHPLSGLLAQDLIVASGQVNSLAGLNNDPSFIQISAPVQPGNSGGPVIDRTGAIVGVVVSKVNVIKLAQLTGDFAQNINFAIKPEVLKMFLDANRVPYRTTAPAKRLEGTELAEKARSFTVQVSCSS